MTLLEPDRSRLATEATRVRDAGVLGRSDVLARLFDFLLDCSLEGRAPKEVEVAQQVFGRGGDIDMGDDASVRVYIHRLRRKLDEYYAANGEGERLMIPRGEYRLMLAAIADADALAPTIVVPAAIKPSRRPLWIALAIVAALNLAAWAIFVARRPADPLAPVRRSALWSPLVSSTRQTFVVTGDYYIFGEAPDAMEVTRLVREFALNSRDDLDRYMMQNPEMTGRYVDLDLHYLPVSVAPALQALLPIAQSAITHSPAPLRMLTMSHLTPERLKIANLLYIGYLSGLGLLREPLFDASGFAIGLTYDELVDRRTRRHYISDWSSVSDGRTPRRDYAYLASMPGPSGNRILIVAGTRDAAVTQAAEIARDPAQLAQIDARTGHAESFEALFEVRAIGNLNLDSALVLARPLRAGAAWRPDVAAPASFPDELSTEPPPPPRR